MKTIIALPSRNGRIDDHFGHCESYTIVTLDENNTIMNQETLAAPQSCGCKSGIIGELKSIGVEMMLAGNMGTGAVEKMKSAGIKVVRGCSGSIEEVIKSYFAGRISDSGESCHHHHRDSEHNCDS